MIKFDVYNSTFQYCYITDEDMKCTEFSDGISVARVHAVKHDNSECTTYVLVREKKDKDNNTTNYELVSECETVRISENIIGIMQLGNHFLVERTKTSYSGNDIGRETIQVDYVDYNGSKILIERSKLPGLVRWINEDVVIVTNEDTLKSCLFSLKKSDINSIEYSSIDAIDGDTFFVTDTVSLNEDETIKDRFMFKMDYSGKRISPVYMRSICGFTDDELDFPYLFIRERRLIELQENYKKEKEAEKSLRKS